MASKFPFFCCRVYLRHCVLAARKLGVAALDSFLDHTWLASGSLTMRQWLELHPEILLEEPDATLAQRYGG